MTCRVTFLDVQEGPTCGQKTEILVEVVHLSRADAVARAQGGFRPNRWHLYSVVEVEVA